MWLRLIGLAAAGVLAAVAASQNSNENDQPNQNGLPECQFCEKFYNKYDGIRLSICGHRFHTACLAAVTQLGEQRGTVFHPDNKCPICKSKISERDVATLRKEMF